MSAKTKALLLGITLLGLSIASLIIQPSSFTPVSALAGLLCLAYWYVVHSLHKRQAKRIKAALSTIEPLRATTSRSGLFVPPQLDK